ncbi:5771_t:CDS:2, partial [Dentiscutata heterogama]
KWIENFDKEIRESNRHILLILNSVSLHITGAITLTNIELHYHCIQLQHAINQDEARESNIYKVNQLQAIRWVK